VAGLSDPVGNGLRVTGGEAADGAEWEPWLSVENGRFPSPSMECRRRSGDKPQGYGLGSLFCLRFRGHLGKLWRSDWCRSMLADVDPEVTAITMFS
jgi:hypothetical protein